MIRRLSNFIRRSPEEHRLFFAAVLWLAVSRLATWRVPFRRIAPYLGRHMGHTPASLSPEPVNLFRQVRWAVQTAARYAPWRCLCLEQAMTAKALLHRRGMQSTLYLGVARDETGELKAHAWLRCGSVILTGARDMKQYTVVSSFSEKK